MAEQKQVYKCEACGNIVEVLHGADGELVCCGDPMVLLDPKTADEGKEKHVPVVEAGVGAISVKVGSNPHPMEEKHYIEWIEIMTDNMTCRHYLSPGQDPQTMFEGVPGSVTAREYCNVHGLWKS